MKEYNKKPTVGLITMHRVLNYGSALQAYALQEAIERIGYQVEIIDYLYPNKEHQLYWEFSEQINVPKLPWYIRCTNKIKNILKRLSSQKRIENAIDENKFNDFYSAYFHLSAHKYPTRFLLGKNPPMYDIYLTGSDQVWNPKFIGYDTSFMLSFVQDIRPKISYASSFATDTLPKQYIDCYRHELGKYLRISVREESGKKIINDFSDCKTEVTCDPTFLLEKKQWVEVANLSNIEIKEPYMLIFILDYAYDPYPSVFKIIEDIHRKLQLKIVVLHGRMSEYMKTNQAVYIKNSGPADFIKLFSSASFVITTSFHGTAFALICNIPFFAIVKDKKEKDSRIYHLLETIGAEKHALLYNQPTDNIEPMQKIDDTIHQKLKLFKMQSLDFLKEALFLATSQIINK